MPEPSNLNPDLSEPVRVHASAEHDQVRLGFPSVLPLPGGRILVAMDQLGPGVRQLPGAKGRLAQSNRSVQGKVFASADGGRTWALKLDYPFSHGCLFRDGASVYLLGQNGPVQAQKSADGGETWSKPATLAPPDDAQAAFALSPVRVRVAGDEIAVALMRVTQGGGRRILTSALAPALMRARKGSNLLSRKSWLWSEPAAAFREWITPAEFAHFGLPFFDVPNADAGQDVGNRRWANRPGWAYPHALRIQDADHYWHDAEGRTLHLLCTADAHRSQFAALLRMRELPDGGVRPELQPVPAGGNCVFVPLPGGGSKFDVLYDEPSGLYWLFSHQVRDSMRRAERLPRERAGLPAGEQALLQLAFSRNLVDWCFAGLVAGAEGAHVAEPAMAVRDQELHLTWVTSGGPNAEHRATEVVHAVLRDFRSRVYGQRDPKP